MRKLILIMCCTLVAGYSSAQNLKEADVPHAVKEAFKRDHPGQKVDEWEKEGEYFEAETRINNMETSFVYNAQGQLIETEVEIKISELPNAITDYFAKHMSGKKILEASRITRPTGEVNFEIETKDAEYLFDASGNLIREEAGDDKPDDKD